MKASALSILCFGVYLAILGLLLLLVPEATCRLGGLRFPGETIWPRMAGALFIDLAFYCIQASRTSDQAFFRRTILMRPWTLVLLAAWVGSGLENPAILAFGLVDLAATTWTVWALRRENELVTTGRPVRLDL